MNGESIISIEILFRELLHEIFNLVRTIFPACTESSSVSRDDDHLFDIMLILK